MATSTSPNVVFVGNLAYAATEAMVHEALQSRVGPVESVTFFMLRSGRPRGSALVTFSTPELAQRAVAECQELDIAGRPIWLREDRGPREAVPRQAAPAPRAAAAAPRAARAPRAAAAFVQNSQPTNQVFVGNLDFNVTQEDLNQQLFPLLAGCTALELRYNYAGRSKGCAVASFPSVADAQSVVANPPQITLGQREVFFREYLERAPSSSQNDGGAAAAAAAAAAPRTRAPRRRRAANAEGATDAAPAHEAAPAQPRARRGQKIEFPEVAQPCTRVFIGNLPFTLSFDELKDFASQFGNVVSADLPVSKNGRARGWGVAEYESVDVATQAIEAMYGQQLGGRTVIVHYDRA